MTPLTQHIRDEEKKFDEKFSLDWWDGFGTTEDITKLGIDGIKSHILSSKISMLEKQIEEYEGMMVKVPLEGSQVKELIYNCALSDVIVSLQETIKELK